MPAAGLPEQRRARSAHPVNHSTGVERMSPAMSPAGPQTPRRAFSCPQCSHRAHRDLIAVRNLAARGGGTTSTTVLVESVASEPRPSDVTA